MPVLSSEEFDDGSMSFEFGDEPEEEIESYDDDFYENLAEKIPEEYLNKISYDILEGIERDKESRSQWEEMGSQGLKYLGFTLETTDKVPFNSACRAFDSTLSASFLRLYSTFYPELFPPTGPAHIRLMGPSSEEQKTESGKIAEWLNYYLTIVDKDYYDDSKRVLNYAIFLGTAFRKTYLDPITNMPTSRFVSPYDLIINNNCISLLSSDRITHKISLTRKEFYVRQSSGFYRELDVSQDETNLDDEESSFQTTVRKMDGISADMDMGQKKSLFHLYESYVDLSLTDFDSFKREGKNISIPLPYIVTVDPDSKKIMSIYRNWDPEDDTFAKREFFTKYEIFPGFGLYGYGLAHIAGSNAVVLTMLERITTDAAILSNFPGGVIQKGSRMENNDIMAGAGEYIPIDTGGLPIKDAFSPMPYKEPSPVILELWREISFKTQQLLSTTDLNVAEQAGNVAVGAVLAKLESSTRLQNAFFQSLHESLTKELGILFDLFKEVMPNEVFEFQAKGKNMSINGQDFQRNDVKVIPVSDPILATSTQRAVVAETKFKIAMMAPELFNMRNVVSDLLLAIPGMSQEDVERLLLPEAEPSQEQQVVDPNMVMMADIEQRREQALLKDKEVQLKTEGEAFKAQLQYETEKEKISAQRDIAEEKNETDLAIQEMKLQEKGIRSQHD